MPFSFKPNQASSAPADSAPTKAPVPTSPVNSAAPSMGQQPPMQIPLGSMPLSGREMLNKISTFQIILYTIFGITLVITIALFAYEYYLLSRIDSQKTALDEQDKSLGSLKLGDMQALSNRIKVVNQVLSEHASVSTAFLILEKSVEGPVTYKKFNLTKNPTTSSYDLMLNGIAPSYKAIAQQLDTLKKDEFSKDLVPKLSYSGIGASADDPNKINFSLSLSLAIEGKLPEVVFSEINSNQNTNTVDTSVSAPAQAPVATSSVKGTVTNTPI